MWKKYLFFIDIYIYIKNINQKCTQPYELWALIIVKNGIYGGLEKHFLKNEDKKKKRFDNRSNLHYYANINNYSFSKANA